MIVCVRTIGIPVGERERFLAWIEENRSLREAHGILFELVLERSTRRGPSKTLQPADTDEADAAGTIVITAWTSHEAFDAWIETPDRDLLTASDVHGAVRYGPITRYDLSGGYINLDRLTAVTEPSKEAP
jgi:heme-degrading monooxygenase HmoA